MGVEKKGEIVATVETGIESQVADQVSHVQGAVKLKVIIEDLIGQIAVEEKVCATSEIKENRTFTKREILGKMMEFVQAKKLDLSGAQLVKEVNDSNGELLLLSLKFANEDGSYQLLTYTIKGVHEGNQSSTSNIDITFWDKDDMPEGGDIVGEYDDGNWILGLD